MCDDAAMEAAPGGAPRPPPFRRAALHLGGLWALAFAQPLLGLLGQDAGFFVARGSTAGDILVLALGYTLVPPLAAAAIVAGAGALRPALGRALLAALVGLIVAALVLPPAGDVLGGSALALVPAALAGAGAAVAYDRAPPVRSVLTVLSPAPLIVVALFLVVSPVWQLVRPGSAAGSVAGPETSTVPIVQVVYDELPLTTLQRADGRLDARRFPNFARLAAQATWYRNATTVAGATLDAVPTQLTGERPRPGQLPTTLSHPRNLFTLFARSHDPVVWEPITDLCPAKLCPERRPPAGERLSSLASDLSIVVRRLLLPGDLRRGLPSVEDAWDGFGRASEPVPSDPMITRQRLALGHRVGARLAGDDATAGFAAVEQELASRHARPPLVFVHSTLPHGPWRFLPGGRRYALHGDPFPGMGEKRWGPRQWAADALFARHVLQAQYADRLLGRLLDTLRARGLYDRAVIVVTADHGASFTAGELRRRVERANLAEIAPVPLIVKAPGQRRGAVRDGAVRTIDVLPTVAKAAGVRVPWRTDGRPADERPVDTATPVDVTVAGEPGRALPLATVLARRRARLATEAGLLRRGPYAVGPRPDLLGRQVAAAAPDGDARADIDDPAGYARLPAAPAPLPALVTGAVRGLEADAPLAVAVDGRVVATTRVLPARAGGLTFAALVPPAALAGRDGVRVTVARVLPGGGLAAIGSAPGRAPERAATGGSGGPA